MAKILLIEDDKFLHELMARKLQSAGFETVSAFDGESGVTIAEKAGQNGFDIILLDLILPGINGFEVLSKLKANPATASIPVIILSNLGQKEDIEKGLDLGAVDYLVKAQFTPAEILNKVKQTLILSPKVNL
jgi:DNA-binding response OmpR family regulator